ncbi:hypothetical protein AUK04_02200 [Candidatus Roizmanbacteria bacterium CG2_30_33_16]|uniref:CMP/dCMP-type deaminase domain-containing protein n=4 Tax=Candidatus Roizmaniibacteriota TaxID=1752723 RepID=A0A2H0C427_9BACT|nr:hypothetical protein [Candidatus Roizmanbacteria bacterium]OIP84575.1 MAG: hypothetical protein AUK04_02200 [Candidatus Roizmanbacteria bacterium CG2_30_33_16]PIP64519.1 MAG: hypothetical protein COW96_02045 [Candidatus Roizmanbacteria bacterium CG22_combo_CG10-13_8_21_14_all_33_16]PIX74068.1 MAG: hypothetical protein COZ39_01120 [Candidatus Roizmanbacteria bacterium CG_4_10_14_3_um_filter_33_21]PJB88204.1 MAG: hypothetical protein CO083_02980 [Candidatus Roizmanbacteria bacterium CG_4_9_14_
MKEFKYKIIGGKKVYDVTDVICRKLLKVADEAIINCFPKPGKGFSVAVLTKTGNIYEGVSYISDTYTLTMHSEATALAHAAIHGETEIIAITGPNCHICKQLIWENSLQSDIDIIVVIKENNQIKKVPISEMMPYPWPEKKQ